MLLLKLFAVLKVCLFALPFAFYKATHHDSTTFKDFVSEHTEEVAGGTFAGITGIFEIFLISKAEVHDIYVGVIKALIMSAVGYGAAWIVKRISQWIQSKLK